MKGTATPSVRRCLLCGDTGIDATVIGRIVTTSCSACSAVLIIEFDPPDEPLLRARIERVDKPDDGDPRVARLASLTRRREPARDRARARLNP
jgi:hypothetical protein